MSTLLVGLVLVAAMSGVGAMLRGRMATGDATTAQQLASQLLAEILQSAYCEPVDSPLFGRETGESSSSRVNWDDVDDYHLCNMSPPQSRAGSILPNTTGWRRDVVVEWVDPNNPATPVGVDQGVKRITVTVQRNGVVLARGVALRTDQCAGAN